MGKVKILFPVFFVFSLLVGAQLLLATTYYVSKTGKDSNSCSATLPCLTIKKGVSKAKLPGDSLIVKAGTYVETVQIWNSGAKGKPITVKANPGDTVVWRSDGGADSAVGPIDISNRSFIRVEGFKFVGSVAKRTLRVHNTSSAKTDPVQGIEIINNTFIGNGNNGVSIGRGSWTVAFVNTGHAIFHPGDAVNTVSGNTFDGNYGIGVVALASNDLVLSNNICRNTKSSWDSRFKNFKAFFFLSGNGAVRAVIENNTVSNFVVDSYVSGYNYNGTGIKFDAGAYGNIIRRNIVHDLDAAHRKNSVGMHCESDCKNNQFYENIVYNIGGIAYKEGSWPTTVSIGNSWKNNVGANCGCGIALINSKSAQVRNNIFFNNVNPAIGVSNLSVRNGGNVFSNNDYFKTGTTKIAVWNAAEDCPSPNLTMAQWVAASRDSNSISADPKFVKPPVDFHLQSASPAKHKGINGVDMGAYPGNTRSSFTLSQEGTVQIQSGGGFLNSDAGQNPASATLSLSPFDWVSASPESQRMNSSKLEVMLDALAARKTASLLIIRNDRIVLEWYEAGRGPTDRHYTASLAESLVGGVSLMVALNDRRIGLDDFASKYIPNWRNDPMKSKILIRHLASHTSGIEDATEPEEWKKAFSKRIPDPFTIALNEAPVLFSPDTDSAYSKPGIAALAYAVTASLKRAPQSDIRTLLQERIMGPLGVHEGEWSIGYGKKYHLDNMDLYATWGGASYTPRAVARVGRLMLGRGNWQGQQLVGSAWVSKSTSRLSPSSNSGIGWRTNLDRQWPSLPRDAFVGAGSGHQVLLVVPSRNLILVRNGQSLMNEEDFWAGPEEYLFRPLMEALN